MSSSDSNPPKMPQLKPFVADLQSALLRRMPPSASGESPAVPEPKPDEAVTVSTQQEAAEVEECSGDVVVEGEGEAKPVVLVTCADGINSPGLEFLVTALVSTGLYDVSVCAPDSAKYTSGNSITTGETIIAISTEVSGAKAFQVSGTPADCVSLALSASLFSWSKPTLVISGINSGSSCGHESFYSGAVAGAKEALMHKIPSIALSLNWKKNESQDIDYKDAVNICMPLIQASIKDAELAIFKNHFFNISIPFSPSSNKGMKITKKSEWRRMMSWQVMSANRNPGGHGPQFMSMHQSLGLQLAQLGRDASAAGAARRANAQRKNFEVESISSSIGKPEIKETIKKHFRLEFVDKEEKEGLDEALDFVALQNGFISVTPLDVNLSTEPEIQVLASDWLTSVLQISEES